MKPGQAWWGTAPPYCSQDKKTGRAPNHCAGSEMHQAAWVGRRWRWTRWPVFDNHAQMWLWCPPVTWFVSDLLECGGRRQNRNDPWLQQLAKTCCFTLWSNRQKDADTLTLQPRGTNLSLVYLLNNMQTCGRSHMMMLLKRSHCTSFSH